jgi:hypothetical protein
MTKTIFQLPLMVNVPSQTIQIPKGSHILSITLINDNVYIHYLSEIGNTYETKRLGCYASGSTVPDNPGFFLGSIERYGTLYHYFESPEL